MLPRSASGFTRESGGAERIAAGSPRTQSLSLLWLCLRVCHQPFFPRDDVCRALSITFLSFKLGKIRDRLRNGSTIFCPPLTEKHLRKLPQNVMPKLCYENYLFTTSSYIDFPYRLFITLCFTHSFTLMTDRCLAQCQGHTKKWSGNIISLPLYERTRSWEKRRRTERWR